MVLTKNLADSSKNAAESAVRAAEAAERSAAASVASVDVDFEVTPALYESEEDPNGFVVGFHLESRGAVVYVHGAELAQASTAHLPDNVLGTTYELLAKDAPAHSVVGSKQLPARIHRGDSVAFRTDPEVLAGSSSSPELNLGILRVVVTYSLEKTGERLNREADWIRYLDEETEQDGTTFHLHLEKSSVHIHEQ